MSQGFYTWSQTASSNASASSAINWAEGQAPSSVNDSARAMMAETAKYRDDIAGGITTGGTATAYTVSSYQSFDTLAHLAGQKIAFVPHATNTNTVGNDVTLNVDSLGAKPIRMAPSIALPNGTLVLGTPYIVSYNNSDAVFYLMNMTNPYNVPLGGFMPFISSTPPNSSFVLPYGQAISRSTYSTLFALCSTTFGTGDGSTTFNLPDLRGRFIVGKDDMGGSAASRVTTAGGGVDGATLGASGGGQSTTLTTPNLPPYTPAGTNATGNTATAEGISQGGAGSAINVITTFAPLTVTFTGTAQGGTSTPFTNLPPSFVLPYLLRVI
jgi:microcystin-dependent protein